MRITVAVKRRVWLVLEVVGYFDIVVADEDVELEME